MMRFAAGIVLIVDLVLILSMVIVGTKQIFARLNYKFVKLVSAGIGMVLGSDLSILPAFRLALG